MSAMLQLQRLNAGHIEIYRKRLLMVVLRIFAGYIKQKLPETTKTETSKKQSELIET